MENGIYGFTGKYKFLSNFHLADFIYQGLVYHSVEHAFQAAKTTNSAQSRRIRECASPAEAKKLGEKVLLRPHWEEIKDQVMYDCLRAKFLQNKFLLKALLNTGDQYLEETNTWNDTYWGVCGGKGLNRLGVLLMRLRNELKRS